jgi:hypothetical protein
VRSSSRRSSRWADHLGGRERRFEPQFAFPVEPAERGFSGGVTGVIDIEQVAARAQTSAQHFVQPLPYARAGLRAHAAFGNAGQVRRVRIQIRLGEYHQVRLGELILEKVREKRIGIRPQHLRGAPWIGQNGVGRQAELVSVVLLERLQHGGGEIHTTSDGLGENHVGPHGQQALGGADEVAEAAAEAGARDFTGIEAGCRGHTRIHQRSSLIVGDDGGAHALLLQQAGRPQQQGGFARSQESACKDQRGAAIALRQAAPTPRRHGQ